MDKKQVANFRRRIKAASTSFGIMGDMMLTMDIDAMTQEDRIALRDALLAGRAPITYKYLDARINGTSRSMFPN